MQISRKSIQLKIWDFESEWIRTIFSILMNPRSELFGLRIQFKSFWSRIHSDGKSRTVLVIIKNLGLIYNRIKSNEIEKKFRIASDEFGLAQMQISK